jgi:hypothetical protein
LFSDVCSPRPSDGAFILKTTGPSGASSPSLPKEKRLDFTFGNEEEAVGKGVTSSPLLDKLELFSDVCSPGPSGGASILKTTGPSGASSPSLPKEKRLDFTCGNENKAVGKGVTSSPLLDIRMK